MLLTFADVLDLVSKPAKRERDDLNASDEMYYSGAFMVNGYYDGYNLPTVLLPCLGKNTQAITISRVTAHENSHFLLGSETPVGKIIGAILNSQKYYNSPRLDKLKTKLYSQTRELYEGYACLIEYFYCILKGGPHLATDYYNSLDRLFEYKNGLYNAINFIKSLEVKGLKADQRTFYFFTYFYGLLCFYILTPPFALYEQLFQEDFINGQSEVLKDRYEDFLSLYRSKEDAFDEFKKYAHNVFESIPRLDHPDIWDPPTQAFMMLSLYRTSGFFAETNKLLNGTMEVLPGASVPSVNYYNILLDGIKANLEKDRCSVSDSDDLFDQVVPITPTNVDDWKWKISDREIEEELRVVPEYIRAQIFSPTGKIDFRPILKSVEVVKMIKTFIGIIHFMCKKTIAKIVLTDDGDYSAIRSSECIMLIHKEESPEIGSCLILSPEALPLIVAQLENTLPYIIDCELIDEYDIPVKNAVILDPGLKNMREVLESFLPDPPFWDLWKSGHSFNDGAYMFLVRDRVKDNLHLFPISFLDGDWFCEALRTEIGAERYATAKSTLNALSGIVSISTLEKITVHLEEFGW